MYIYMYIYVYVNTCQWFLSLFECRHLHLTAKRKVEAQNLLH